MTTFNEYQRLALITDNHKLAKERPALHRAVQALGLTGESGELAEYLAEVNRVSILGLKLNARAGSVADHIKKHIGHGHDLDRDKIRKELGDVLWYVMVLAHALDMDGEEIVQTNVVKLKLRYPEGFSDEASINRTS